MIGPMGIGKSTLAEALAAELGRDHRDSDADIEALTGVTGRELAATHSVDELHQLEAAVLLGALILDRPSVIGAAASVVEDPLVRRALTNRAAVVGLHAPTEVILERQASSAHRRPMDTEELVRLTERRAPLMDEVVDVDLDATNPPEVLVTLALEGLAERPK